MLGERLCWTTVHLAAVRWLELHLRDVGLDPSYKAAYIVEDRFEFRRMHSAYGRILGPGRAERDHADLSRSLHIVGRVAYVRGLMGIHAPPGEYFLEAL